MAFKITIPEPCHENWHAMTPTQKGAFCDTCEKEVIDFTAYSNYELARKLGRGENLCGRFRASQLNTPLPTLERKRWRERMAALGFTALMAGSCAPDPVEDAVEVVAPVENQEKPLQIEVGKVEIDSVTISGQVLDRVQTLPGALILLKDTDLYTQADEDGKYTLTIPAHLIEQHHTLVYGHLGYLYGEKEISPEHAQIDMYLVEDDTLLGDVVITTASELRRIKRHGH